QVVGADRTTREQLVCGGGIGAAGRRCGVPAIEFSRHIEKINARIDICQAMLDFWISEAGGGAQSTGSMRSTSAAGHSYRPGRTTYTVPLREPIACTGTMRSSSG